VTDARLGGLGREALVADAGQLRVGGVVREALVAGTGLAAIIGADSAAASSASVLFGGVLLAAAIKAMVNGAARVTLRMSLAGQIGARSSAGVHFPIAVALTVRVTAQAQVQFARVAVVVMSARMTATSGSAVLAIVATVRADEGAVTVNTS
jgi:hypothetical protein